MGKPSTKLALYALVQLLLFHLSGLVGAVDFHFHLRPDDCTGSAFSFLNIAAHRCVSPAPAGSIRVVATDDQMTSIYFGGRCCTFAFRRQGYGCAVGGLFTGAAWYRIRELHEPEKACDAQAKPTGISYSEESTKGLWILTTDNATEMYTQMDTIPDAQKVDWLQAHGATFQPGNLNWDWLSQLPT